MAKIWPVYEGREPTIGEPWAHLSSAEAIKLFRLRQNDFLSEPGQTPRFGDISRDLTHAGFKYIVVEIDSAEGRKIDWRPGFYKSKITPEEAFDKLIQQALGAELGSDNVQRLEHEVTLDSQGREALKITVVISPKAVRKIGGDAILDALVNVQDRLQEMQELRIPIIEYATEAELAQDGGS